MSNIGSNGKHCDFTFALSDINQCDDIISCLPDFDIWAYIKHDPDSDNGSIHYHFYIHVKQPITIKNLSEKLDIPSNFIEWVRVKTRLIQYLIHKNQPDKKQYDPSLLITNNSEFINKFLSPKDSSIDLHSESYDLQRLVRGDISPDQYIEFHKDSISNLPFYSRQIFLMRIIQLGKEGYQFRIDKYHSRVV